MPTFADAFVLAERAHRGQVDLVGNPYIDHPRAVAALLSYHGLGAVIAGMLHDVVEDSDTTLNDLRRAGYPEQIVAAVDAVTRRPGEEYEDMIARAAADPLGRHVKLADNVHNTWPGRVAKLAARDPAKAARQARRYTEAQATLLAAGATLTPTNNLFSDDALPCPVLSEDGKWCAKMLRAGSWVNDGHAGGHAWMSHGTAVLLADGHYDASALLAGRPADGHLAENCPGPGSCEFWPQLDRASRAAVEARLGDRR